MNTRRIRGGWGGRYRIIIQNKDNDFVSGRINGSIKWGLKESPAIIEGRENRPLLLFLKLPLPIALLLFYLYLYLFLFLILLPSPMLFRCSQSPLFPPSLFILLHYFSVLEYYDQADCSCLWNPIEAQPSSIPSLM